MSEEQPTLNQEAALKLSRGIFDPQVATDPYFIWAGLDPMTRLSRQIVQSGLGCWLASQLKWVWDDLSQIKIPWYMTRVKGLCAWSWYEAGLRLSSFSNQDSFTAAEFCEVHFSEEAKKHGAEEIKNPFWNELFYFKKETGDLLFYTHLPILVNQPPLEMRQAMRLYCAWWDRFWVPMEFWSAEASSRYLEEKLGAIDRHGIAPSAERLRQWRHRLGLVPFKPSVVTRCPRDGDFPPGGFDLEAFELAGIPAPRISRT
jgi:hypothetical protein